MAVGEIAKYIGSRVGIILFAFGALGLASCGGARKPALAAGNECIVTVPKAPFYKNGPAQGYAADVELERGQRVTLLSKKFGYCHVVTGEGEFGYVADDQVKVVPALPKVTHIAMTTSVPPINPPLPVGDLDPLSDPPVIDLPPLPEASP